MKPQPVAEKRKSHPEYLMPSGRKERKTPSPRTFQSAVHLGREICTHLAAIEQREWLVTNGMGSFASGTVAGLITRRYHGLLVAALKPPVGRTLLVTKIDEIADYDGNAYPLGANRWQSGALDPRGYELLQAFRLEGTTPIWTFAFSGVLLEKRIWMEQGAHTTYVAYQLVQADRPVRLALKVLVNYRDFHATTHAGDWRMDVHAVEHGLRIGAFPGAVPFYLLSAQAEAEPCHIWYRNFDLAVERSRGLDDCEDHLHAATFHALVEPGEEIALIFTGDPAADLDGRKAYQRRSAQEHLLLARWKSAQRSREKKAPPWITQLVLAADQFMVTRSLPGMAQARTIIAGYHWFGDWGRDTMVALPGLLLATGRREMAREILRTFAQCVDRGMLPNTFPEGGEAPQYNTVDATLWYFEAVRVYFELTRDTKTLRELFPVLAGIISEHVQGTRYDIHVDPADSLLFAGIPGEALTWMDARVDGRPITPRIGKPIEVNALWFNALLAMAHFARALKKNSSEYESMALRTREGFRRFWNEQNQFCFDVLDGPGGHDPSLRPNQLLAISLTPRLLSPERMRAVVDVCEKQLLVPRGLRSLAPRDPNYRGHYGGPQQERDAAYHQGTAWGWLLGPFVQAHLRVYSDAKRALSFLEPMAQAIVEYGLGTVGEIFDGDAPYTPRGCVAQAWTVGELLRAWVACRGEVNAPAMVPEASPVPAPKR